MNEYKRRHLQDVLQLQIAMANVLIVGITDGTNDLVEDMPRFVFGEIGLGGPHRGLSPNEIFQQIAAFHQLKDENDVLL